MKISVKELKQLIKEADAKHEVFGLRRELAKVLNGFVRQRNGFNEPSPQYREWDKLVSELHRVLIEIDDVAGLNEEEGEKDPDFGFDVNDPRHHRALMGYNKGKGKNPEPRHVGAPCNCESSRCKHTAGECPNKAGDKKAMYVGAICDDCAKITPKQYLKTEGATCEACGMSEEMCECGPMGEVSPPGREKQVKKLKKVLPKTYKDKSGHKKKSNPWAVAWASKNKSEGVEEGAEQSDPNSQRCHYCSVPHGKHKESCIYDVSRQHDPKAKKLRAKRAKERK